MNATTTRTAAAARHAALRTAARTLVHAAALTTAAWLTAPAAHANTAEQGVKCPAGSTAEIGANNQTLRCAAVERVERASVCSPVVFKGNGDVNLNTRMDMVTAGSDTCRVAATGATAPSQALLLPGDVASNFHREVRPDGDVFVWLKPVYKFPEGGPIYVGDAAKGVRCDSGFDGDATFGGHGIRCDRREERVATCDVGWTIERRGGTDKCFMQQIVFGNRVRVDGEYTIPEGSTGLLGNPETHGWNLRRDERGNTDVWVKEAKDYRFPIVGR